jgi:hypothetical protein
MTRVRAVSLSRDDQGYPGGEETIERIIRLVCSRQPLSHED